MESIIRTHEKVLDHLIYLRKKDESLYFVPRKINNKNRLDKGYWFLGNDKYLHLSFWNGEDWKEKIHNIGFVVSNDKNSYIEISAQDSKEKAQFLDKLTKKIGGFSKLRGKDKWYKHYSGTNYIESLANFIQKVKPQIDDIILKEKPQGIKLVDKAFFKKYGEKVIKLRNEQINLGDNNRLARICWNTNNWKFPSGSEGKSDYTETYESETGFGHEEWLFDKSKIIRGYHYGFLRPLDLNSKKHQGKIYNIILFTKNNCCVQLISATLTFLDKNTSFGVK